MSYSNSIEDNALLLRRTVLGITDLRGRSRRSEVGYYWIANRLLVVVLSFMIEMAGGQSNTLPFRQAIELTALLPFFALFVRRLHDIGFSGWFGLLLPISLLIQLPEIAAALQGNAARAVAEHHTTRIVVGGLCGVVALLICLIPGNKGPNRFGRNPRPNPGRIANKI